MVGGKGWQMGNEQVQQLTVINPEDLDSAREAAAEHGVALEELTVRGIEPVLTITLVLTGIPVAVSTVVHLLDRQKGGQVIDLRPGAPKVLYRSKDVLYGLVIVLTHDGKVTVEVKEPRGMFGEVLDALKGIIVDLAGASTETVASNVTETVGDKAKVMAQALPPPK